MPPNPGKPMPASKKRSFSVYTADEKVVHFKIGDHTFIAHEDILDEFKVYWRSDYDIETKELLIMVTLPAFCGFLHWAYNREIPNDETIKKFPYPEEEENSGERGPLSCSMAIELYDFAKTTKKLRLLNRATSFLFNYFKKHRTVPSINCLRHIYSVGFALNCKWGGDGLRRLFADIYYHLGCKELPDNVQDTFSHQFLAYTFRRHCQLLSKTATPFLKLADYHYLPKSAPEYDKDYPGIKDDPCQEMYIIE
ncbi:hypothetical protein CC80DRAFT_582896 [Byssothecium circinans]|uniref:BTB domain-containing protein n=1 Tax=Byssothecium circinans TaxID=147558 RepID=A0A6A5UBR7_9PLEO|nr:hypothetical protein CC80DRAFT_582896 [Byssothecium circinans]